MLRLVTLLSFLYAGDGLSYSFTTDFTRGFYWASYPITIEMVNTDFQGKEDFASHLSQAVNDWESAVGKELFTIPSQYVDSSAGNFIRWSDNFGEETGFDPFSTLAVTTRYSSGTYIVKTEIILNGAMQSLVNNHNQSLFKTILHELGHVINLNHSDVDAIMLPHIGTIDQLTADDIDGANDVVDQTLYRQSIGYRSPLLSDQEESNALGSGCGSIDLNSSGGGSGGQFLSLLLGLLLALFLGQGRGAKFSH